MKIEISVQAMPESQILRDALAVYGGKNQKIVAIEEMAELQKELCKNLRGEQNYSHLAEEIADVQIMLEQMIMLYDCRADVVRWRREKLERLKELMSAFARMTETAKGG